MNLREIEKLLEKYESGETTLEEEALLREFFKGEDVPVHLSHYRAIFGFFGDERSVTLTDENFDEKVLSMIAEETKGRYYGRRRFLLGVLAVAASIAILFGIFLNRQSIPADTYDDPRLAYIQTKRALMLVSSGLNEGISKMSEVSEFNEGIGKMSGLSEFETGMNSLGKISIMDKSKNLITFKKQ